MEVIVTEVVGADVAVREVALWLLEGIHDGVGEPWGLGVVVVVEVAVRMGENVPVWVNAIDGVRVSEAVLVAVWGIVPVRDPDPVVVHVGVGLALVLHVMVDVRVVAAVWDEVAVWVTRADGVGVLVAVTHDSCRDVVARREGGSGHIHGFPFSPREEKLEG
jgi:hypothetical protein